MARLGILAMVLMAGCTTRSESAQHSGARRSDDLDRLVTALDTMPGALQFISEGSAQMMQFTYVPQIVDPLIGANGAAVPKLVACLSRSQPSKVRGPEGGVVPVGVVCAQVLYSTAFFQRRLSSTSWPDGFQDSIEVGYRPTSAELERAQGAWQAYLSEATPE